MLTHEVSTVQVFSTDQYKNFNFILGNRPLNMHKIARIIKDIESGNDMLEDYPINVRVVKDKMDILDGQHRFYICKKLKRRVNYIIVKENKSIAEIAKVNSNVEKWIPKSFIDCYIANNNPHYIELQAFIDKYKINIGSCVILLASGVPRATGYSNDVTTAFQYGKFEVKFKKEAESIADDCKRFEKSPHWRERDFIVAIYKIKEAGKIEMGTLAAAFNKNPEMLTKQLSAKKYIYNLEEIANVGKHKRVVIS